MDTDRFPRDLEIQPKTRTYVIRQLSDYAFWVKNWTPECPLDKSFAILDGQYLSDEPKTEDRQEAVNALLEAVAKEDTRA
jgi:hypothetical protein